MAVLELLEHPDPRLREVSAEVTEFGDDMRRLAGDLAETLRARGGIGLSAPQAGELVRVLVLDLSDGQSAPEVFINPRILHKEAYGLVQESCLSVPGVVGNVIRATRLRVQAQDAAGESFECELDNMPAVCLQHELDHLDGRLFIDRLPFWRRWSIGRKLRTAA